MKPRVIFKSDGGELEFKFKNKYIWEDLVHFVAFYAESGANGIKFCPREDK